MSRIRTPAKASPILPSGEPIGPKEGGAASAPSPELLAWQRFLRANWLLNGITQNFMEPLVQFEALPARLREIEHDLAEGRIPPDRLPIVEEELRTAQLWFADMAVALEDADQAIQRLLGAVWTQRKAARGIGG